MQANYDENYIDAVKAMASKGMEVRLLSGRALRSLDSEASSSLVQSMSDTTELAVLKFCVGTLAVSGHHALAIHSNDEGALGAPETSEIKQKVELGKTKG